MTADPVKSDSRPWTPILSASCSPSSSPNSFTDDDLDCDDLTLPPALHRCSSTSSIPCECDDLDSDDDCHTPPLSCEALENSIDSLLSLHLGDDDSGEAHSFGMRKTQGLGLDMGLGIDVVNLP